MRHIWKEHAFGFLITVEKVEASIKREPESVGRMAALIKRLESNNIHYTDLNNVRDSGVQSVLCTDISARYALHS